MPANPKATQLSPTHRTLQKLILCHVTKNSCADVNKCNYLPHPSTPATCHSFGVFPLIFFVIGNMWQPLHQNLKSVKVRRKDVHRLSKSPFIHQENVGITGIFASGTRKWKVRCESLTPNSQFMWTLCWIFDYVNETHHIISQFRLMKINHLDSINNI